MTKKPEPREVPSLSARYVKARWPYRIRLPKPDIPYHLDQLANNVIDAAQHWDAGADGEALAEALERLEVALTDWGI